MWPLPLGRLRRSAKEWALRNHPDSYGETDMAAVQLKCEIEGCGMSWSVASPRDMKTSMVEHRQKFHPDPQPNPKGPRPRRSFRA